MAAIEIHDLVKRFGGVEAVRGLTFSVEPGRVTGFLGPNGAGKSTTLKALLGLVQPSAGSATFDGRAYHELDRPALAHRTQILRRTLDKVGGGREVVAVADGEVVHDADAVVALVHQGPYQGRPQKPAAAGDEPVQSDLLVGL